MRLFFALELPIEARDTLARLRTASDAYRWVEPGLLHITLAFLGEQPEERLAGLRAAAQSAARAHDPAALKLGSAGSFGPPSAPRVLWIGLAGHVPALARLHNDLAAELTVVGATLEHRPFRPHITLARRRERAVAGQPLRWPPVAAIPALPIPLRDFVLVRSQLSPTGPNYTVVDRFRLGQRPTGG